MTAFATLLTLIVFSVTVGRAVKFPGPFPIGCAVFTGGCFAMNLILMLKER